MAEPSSATREDAVPDRLSPRELRRQRRMATSRGQILDTAEELFGNHGYRATSLQQVADRCEFSVGALYQFFSGKEELLRAVMERRGLVQMTEMRAAVNGSESDEDGGLFALVHTIIAFHRRYPAFGRLSARVYSAGSDAPSGYRLLEENYQAAMDLYATVVTRGQRRGTVRAGDPQALARMLSSMVTAFHRVDAELGQQGSTLTEDEFRAIVAQAFAAR